MRIVVFAFDDSAWSSAGFLFVRQVTKKGLVENTDWADVFIEAHLARDARISVFDVIINIC